MKHKHGFCECCKNNPSFFDNGLCKNCLNYMLEDLGTTDVIMIMSSLMHRLKKKGDKTYVDVERGLSSWVYGGRKK